MSLQESSSNAGRRRFPPPARRYSPISVIARTPETVSRPNSRSMAARSSCNRSKTSFALWVTDVLNVFPSVRSVIRKLHIDAEIRLLDHGNDLLQRVTIFAAHSNKVALNGGLRLELRVLDQLHDVAGLFDCDTLLQRHFLPHR